MLAECVCDLDHSMHLLHGLQMPMDYTLGLAQVICNL